MAANGEFVEIKLSELFDKIWNEYEYFEGVSEPLNSDSVQTRLHSTISNTEKAIGMVNDLNLFTSNEHMEEVTTNEIKYMLLPALLGYFTNKLTHIERFEAVKKSQIYFIDFIRLCKLYEVTDAELPKAYSKTEDSDSPATKTHTKPSQADFEEQSKKRQKKIERYRQQKELEQNLKELYIEAKKEYIDEEIKREYYMSLLKKWLIDSFDALESIESEIPLLEYMLKMKAAGILTDLQPKHHTQNSKEKLRPFIITKDALQKKVFGLGYPGVPTFTVDEFYDKRVEEGIFPAAGTPAKVEPNDEEQARQKEKVEAAKEEAEDDDETVQKARQWDEYTDDHRRGWGNTQNKG